MVVPCWQGGDDRRLADGAEKLADLIASGPRRASVAVPAIDSGGTSAVRHELGDWQCLRPDQVMLAGTRDVDPPEEEFCRHHRLRLLDVPTLLDDPSALRDVLPDQAAVYLHLDLDVVDPAALPAVAVPVPGGLSPTALTAALATIHRGADVVGIGITEYVPSVGHDETVVARILAALGLT